MIDLLNDSSEPVVLWAVKASKFVLPPILGNAVASQNVPLLPAFLKAAQKYAKSGPIIQSVYDSLKLESQGNNAVAPATVKIVVPVVIDAMQSVLQLRITQYQAGVPAQPVADATATSFMVDGKVWKELKDPQRLVTVQRISDLMSVIAKRWSDASLNQKKELTEVINKASEAAWVIGDLTGNDKIKAASFKVIPSNTPGEVEQRVDNLRGVLKTIPAFAALKDPPPVSAMNPPSEPTSQPTSAASAPGT